MSARKAKLKGLAWIALTTACALVLALGLSSLAKLIPWPAEERLSRSLDLFPEASACHSPASPEPLALFQKVIQRIHPLGPADGVFPLTVDVIRGETVNAFASLGGHVFVYEGLINQAESADELAGIIAHEIEHVKRRHILQGVLVRLLTVEFLKFALSGSGPAGPELLSMILNMRFSREQEHEADEGGLKRLQEAGVDVQGFKRFFDRAADFSPSLLSDHPSDESRARLVAKYGGGKTKPLLTPKEWQILKRICR